MYALVGIGHPGRVCTGGYEARGTGARKWALVAQAEVHLIIQK